MGSVWVDSSLSGFQCRATSSYAGETEGSAVSIPDFFRSTGLYIERFVKRLGIKEEHSASWFSHENSEANMSREKLALDSLEMLIQWLKEGGNVAIHGEKVHNLSPPCRYTQGSMIRCDEQYAFEKVSRG